MPVLCSRLLPAGLVPDRRGAVALMAAIAMPVLLAAVAMGVEVGNWSAMQVTTQRISDMAAIAAGKSYAADKNLEEAANAGATMAELNGASGTSTRSWTATSSASCATGGTLTDGNITLVVCQSGQGLRTSTDPTFKATVFTPVALTIARLISTATTETLNAAALAEVVSVQAWGGPQPCVTALKTAAQGGSGITYSGWTTMEAYGCSIRSNAGVTETGSGGWNTQGIYAAGLINIPNWVDVDNNSGATLAPVPNDGTIPDPYASVSAVQAALTKAGTVSGSSITCSNQKCGLAEGSPNGSYNGSYCAGQGTGSVSCTLEPGNYGGFNVTSGGPYYFTLEPGMYYFNGNINLTNYTVTTGSAVTVVTSGTFTGANTFDFTLTAPDAAQAAATGGIAGLALAGSTKGTIGVSGNPQVSITGAMYFPNATFSGAGSTTASSSSCFEIFAASITLSGDSGYSGTCATLGIPSFGSTYASSFIPELVQ